jgi:AcrR family transcriptional regulator
MENVDSKTVDSTERRRQRRRAIVEAAAPIFADAGYDGAEMDRVATQLGIAKGTLYLYFAGKQDLFFACVDEGMRQMQATINAARSLSGDPFEQISAAIRAYLKFFDEHPHFVELLIQERAIFRDRKKPTYFEHRDANRGAWRDLYFDLQSKGRIRGDLPIERILDTIGSLLYGAMFFNRLAGRSITLDEQHQAMLEVMFYGLLTDEERVRTPRFPLTSSK